MKLTLSWLKDHLDTDASLDQIVERLTAIGLEVEHVDDKAALKPFVIAKVLSAEKHPDADKLQVLKVDTGSGEPIQVVCGAPNARAGLVGAFAAPGAYIPGIDTTLGVGKIRGVESRGMMCSERELQLSDEHTGIIDLPADAPVGASFAAYAHLDDPVIEINLTPNRPDATSIHGIARDLAAAGLGRLKTAPIEPIKGEGACPVKVTIEAPELCPGFALRLVRGVKNGPSPQWLQQRLLAIGLRPINALVDVTNYITFDRGRPLHVYRSQEGQGRSRRPPRARRRDGAGARPARIQADAGDVRHRRWNDRGLHCRRDGRRTYRLRRKHHRCADRIGAVGTAQHRPHRPHAWHHHRCALPLSSVASIRNSWCRASTWRPAWCSASAAETQAKSRWSAMPATRRRSFPSRYLK
jgi:tRNA-binding EMAP/Myf-like protein